MLKEFKIEVFSNGDHYPGSTVQGKLIVSVDRPKIYRAVIIKLSGKAMAYAYQNQTGLRPITYVDDQVTVWTAEDSPTGVLSGEHTFTFQFKLPLLSHRGIKYAVSAIIQRSKFKPNHSVNAPLVVKERINNQDLAEEPQTATLSKRFRFTSGLISVSVSIPRTGFSPGERVPLTVRINNLTSKTVRVSSTLVRHDLHAQGNSFDQRIRVVERRGGIQWGPQINPRENTSFQTDLQIPEQISLIPNFNQYFVLVEVKFPWSSNKELRIPLLIESQVALQSELAIAGMLSHYLQSNPNISSVQQPGSADVTSWLTTLQQQRQDPTPPSYSEAVKK